MSTTPPTPRRKLRLKRWFVLLSVAIFAWSGWREFAFRSALAQAEKLGWQVVRIAVFKTLVKDWRAAFKMSTWTDRVTYLFIPTSKQFEQHREIAHRLNPQSIQIHDASSLRDLSAFQGLVRLEGLWLNSAPKLTNVDALRNLHALRSVWLIDASGLTNMDALKSSPLLNKIDISRTGLSRESVAALKAALPNTQITGP